MDEISRIDRHARDKFICLVEEFIDARITAFEFEDSVHEILSKTNDDLVHKTEYWLRSYFLDSSDWKYEGDRDSWDFFQRILLLLNSNARNQKTELRWPLRLIQGLPRVVTFAYLAAYITALFTAYPLVVVPLFHCGGFAAMMLVGMWSHFKQDNKLNALFPFNSVSELLAIRRSVPNFEKRRFMARQMAASNKSILSQVFSTTWNAIGITAYAVMLVVAVFLLICGAPIVALAILFFRPTGSSFTLVSHHVDAMQRS